MDEPAVLISHRPRRVDPAKDDVLRELEAEVMSRTRRLRSVPGSKLRHEMELAICADRAGKPFVLDEITSGVWAIGVPAAPWTGIEAPRYG